MEDALRTVLDRAESNGGTVEWGDVDNSLTSGQWGRLIEKGLLKSADGDGFRVVDADGVRSALDDDFEVDDDDGDEDTSWTTWDKLAGVGSLGMFAGYSIPTVRDSVGRSLDLLLGPLDAALPFYVVVLVLAIATGLYSTLLQANLMDMEKMGEYQQRMKDIQNRMSEAQESGDEAEVEAAREEQMEAMGDQLGMFKLQFRPMVWIMLFTIPVFLWLYWMTQTGQIPSAETTVVMPLIGEVDWTSSVLFFPAWIAWYFVCSMSFVQVIRKALNVDMSPTTS